ncbi:hypothetical protein COT48_01375 [Candidatus Woesearchaeota archaeon CG08_land_8_20_14_0_20_47_9]|nr:MAG: hypothetical protein AUJ69_00685 [Candidatus Woesearchaeota archaeon CG1_02_47_18]PIN72925.1 MAG: hypothetical protein COV22_01915 [Candidatus Woesearchaeota archaeon CG10_big_fil_rev_8_21_14_0_10_47_5]PIO04245.1 MAG: hypothetical protein COT48_01375 [Candidatus Woesearchaeota archaeon CG08_land_8_20_14_0_20_47_9]
MVRTIIAGEPGRLKRILFISILVIVIDRLTKAAIMHQGRLLSTGLLELSYSCNSGSAFGLFQGHASMLVWVSLIALGFIFWRIELILKRPALVIPAGLIIGGIVSNAVDRLLFGCVVDFINLHFWPSFNIADSALCVGAVMASIAVLKA